MQHSRTTNPYQLRLKSKGINFNAAFFLVVSVAFFVILVFLFFPLYLSFSSSSSSDWISLLGWCGLFFFNTQVFIYTMALSLEQQWLEINSGKLLVIKKRPFLRNEQLLLEIDQIKAINPEKLIMNFKNVWYAFLFHHTDPHDEDTERFLVPHVYDGKNSFAFFEFASDDTKLQVIQQLKTRISSRN
ncbi:MAG: hypothetical protein ACNS62_08395 [Candidatus Cyclobacteriaceae bacterium M3_2C_046]